MICDYVPNEAEFDFFCDARDDALELLLAFFLCICRFPRFFAAPLPIVNKSLEALGHSDQRGLVEDAVGQREGRCKVSWLERSSLYSHAVPLNAHRDIKYLGPRNWRAPIS